MKFKRGKKGEKGSESCESCPSHRGPLLPGNIDTKEMMKRLKEMKRKIPKREMCPYVKECTHKIFRQDYDVMCSDSDEMQQTKMIHLAGKHVWNACRHFGELQREKEGKTPAEWAKLKKVKKK